MTFIFYDTETTGLEPAFDQTTQFAAIVTDDQFNILEEVNLRCRLKPHIVASPGAMRVTKVGPKAIQSATLSCYQMTEQIRSFIERWSPAVLVGFNNISFDEPMLRHMFFQGLHPTYLTNTNGNTRLDILRLAHAVASHKSEAINVPLNDKGKPSFKLEHLIAANGLSHGNAHDALADTRMTLSLAKYLKECAPQIWDDFFACRSRHTVEAMLTENELFLVTDRAFKKPTILAGVITKHPTNPAAVAVFDMEYDPALYLNIDHERALQLLKASPRPIRIMRTNNLPIAFQYRDGIDAGVELSVALERLKRIRAHPTFSTVVGKAMAAQADEYEPPLHIEQTIYGGFPSRDDAKLMEAFHRTPWADRYVLANGFSDRRYQEFAERIIYAEAPDALPPDRLSALDSWRRERHNSGDDVPWQTIRKSKDELAEIKEQMAVDETTLVAEIGEYLEQLAAMDRNCHGTSA